jgi:ribosomal protein S18 acetylase RimI-like enzyme
MVVLATSVVMIQIREAAPGDIPAVARVHVKADRDTYSVLLGSKAYALGPDESELRWRRALCNGDALLVADDCHEVVGFGHAQGNRIDALYVLGSHQRRGIGKALLRGLLTTLNKLGVSEARFDVVAKNENAIAFYRAQGAYLVDRCINRDRDGDREDVVFALPTSSIIAP